jgi:hypothetical protein
MIPSSENTTKTQAMNVKNTPNPAPAKIVIHQKHDMLVNIIEHTAMLLAIPSFAADPTGQAMKAISP